jgi:FkbM family methyltransferase
MVKAIDERQRRKQKKIPGPLGDFYRMGGNNLLYENLPVSETDWVWDVGGFHGEWTSKIMSMYGCRVELFEPAPNFIELCKKQLGKNLRIRINPFGLGGESRTATFVMLDNGTSEFSGLKTNYFTSKIMDVTELFNDRKKQGLWTENEGVISCIKLNIEGGEYEVLEKLLSTGMIRYFRCLLIQFHRQPIGYENRYKNIICQLQDTHCKVYSYPYVWERWDLLP